MPSIARGGALNLIGAAVTAVTGVLLIIVVTRALPQDEAGIFFALTSVFLLAETVARLGTGTGLVYFIARLRSLGQPDRIRAFQRVALTPVVVLSLVTGGRAGRSVRRRSRGWRGTTRRPGPAWRSSSWRSCCR